MHLLGVGVLPNLETLDQRAKTVAGVERDALCGSGGVSWTIRRVKKQRLIRTWSSSASDILDGRGFALGLRSAGRTIGVVEVVGL
jgi:hypothetical protein